MEKVEFVRFIFNGSCERCPIEDFCSLCKSIMCHSTAKQYYETHRDKKGVFICPIKDSQKTG